MICAGLKSSVFQGYLLIGDEHFEQHFPSVSGTPCFFSMADPNYQKLYTEILSDRLKHMVYLLKKTGNKLASSSLSIILFNVL